MKSLNILAFSSSREGNKRYLETAVDPIKNFFGDALLSVAFIPFASTDNDYEAYTANVRKGLAALPYIIKTVEPANARSIVEQCDVIMVGGGNTFKLLHDLYALNLTDLIKQKAYSGTPYIGWSAGSNITGQTIGTTNDMPIIQPESFKALAFFPFHINPHYHNVVMEGFNGETRDQRLAEFLKVNQESAIVCLPEGTALQLQHGEITLLGIRNGIRMFMEDGRLVRQKLEPGVSLFHATTENGAEGI